MKWLELTSKPETMVARVRRGRVMRHMLPPEAETIMSSLSELSRFMTWMAAIISATGAIRAMRPGSASVVIWIRVKVS